MVALQVTLSTGAVFKQIPVLPVAALVKGRSSVKRKITSQNTRKKLIPRPIMRLFEERRYIKVAEMGS
tara:strand:+ start:430 stop:633 length:204 start_codon:yes stop_codon:yes gene_type:complete